MPETQTERMNRILRDHQGYTGDGHGNVGNLPVGDRSTALRPLYKRDLREVFIPLAEAADNLNDAAQRAEVAAGGAAGDAEISENAANQAQLAALAAGAPLFLTKADGIAGVDDGAMFLAYSNHGIDIYTRSGADANYEGSLSRDQVGVTPAQLGAAGGGANDRDALVKWLDYLAADTSRVGYLDQDYNFATTITHDGDVTIRGPFSNKARLIYTGTGDGLELTGAVDLDGVIVDGNLPIVAIPTATSEAGCLFGIHGPTVGTPGYLQGVRLGRVRAQNTRRRTGLALINLQDFDVEHVRAERCYGHGLHFAGLKDGQIRGYSWYRVGNLGPEGTRLGSGLAFFIEDEPTKQPAEWYDPDGVQSTIHVDVAPGGGDWATDTAWYCHNLNGAGTREFKGVTFGYVTVGNAGKDGAKMRNVEDVVVNGGSVNGAGLRLFVVEESCVNSGFRNTTGQNAGQDTIGLWLDGSEGARHFRPEGDAGYTNGEGQTLNKTPAGVLLDGCTGCFLDADIQHVRNAPYTGIEGSGLSFRDNTDCSMKVTVRDADGLARIGNNTGCSVDAVCIDMARATGTTTAFFYCDDSDVPGAYSDDNTVNVHCVETSGEVVSSYPCRINGQPGQPGTRWKLNVTYQGAFGLPGGVVTRISNAQVARYNPTPIKATRETLAFDTNATHILAHGFPSAPMVQARAEGGLPYEVAISAVDDDEVTLRLYQTDDPTPDNTAQPVPSVSRLVHLLMSPVPRVDGFQW